MKDPASWRDREERFRDGLMFGPFALGGARAGPAGVNCHLLMHGGRWRDYVKDAPRQALRLRKMIESRVRG